MESFYNIWDTNTNVDYSVLIFRVQSLAIIVNLIFYVMGSANQAMQVSGFVRNKIITFKYLSLFSTLIAKPLNLTSEFDQSISASIKFPLACFFLNIGKYYIFEKREIY
jgi:hypothetical protein